MKDVLICGDLHLTDHPPSSCTDSYTDDLFALLEQTVELAKNRQVAAVIWAGDIFHHKAPSKTSHKLVLRVIELIKRYPCPLYIVPGNHDLCVSADTQALTDQGWRLVGDLDGTERFATLNKVTRALEFQRPTAIRHFRYRGPGHHFASRVVDLVTTPNHNWWGSWKDGKALRRKTSAELAAGGAKWRTPAVRSWQGASPGVVKVGTYELPVSLAARLFGWYAAEGTADRSGARITISQSVAVNPDHYAEIEQILTEARMPYSTNTKMIRVNDRSVAEFFIEHFGYAGSMDMRLPRWLMRWDTPELTEFLYAYFRGDGSIQGTTGVRELADYSVASVIARTANRALADDLSEVGVRLGYRMALSADREFPFGETGYVGHASTQGFNRVQTEVGLPRPVDVMLDEMVWCPTLPNEIWLARRNGKMVWTGNSGDRLESLDKQPLGVLFEAGAINLTGWADELPIYGVPWQQDWSKLTDELSAWNDEELVEARAGSLVVTHCGIFPPGSEPIYEHVPAATWATEMSGRGYLYYGHIHSPHGTYSVGGVTFSNQGALSRGSLHESELTREVAVTLWNPDAGFRKVVLDYKPASEVFRLTEAAQVKAAAVSLDDFLAEIGRTSVAVVSTESVLAELRGRNLAPELLALVVELLDA